MTLVERFRKAFAKRSSHAGDGAEADPPMRPEDHRPPRKLISISLDESGLTEEQGRRLRLAVSHYEERLQQIEKWVLASRETSNFTYDIGDSNKATLASLISLITRTQYETVWRYMMELDQDQQIRKIVVDRAMSDTFMDIHDPTCFFGRRIGWYAVARIVKPKVIIETGVDKGLGSIVLCAALLRNELEGFPGRYFGTDIMPQAGYLLTEPYVRLGTILYGDSIESLSRFHDSVDLFINDSDHSAAYEVSEYKTIEAKLSRQAIVLGDNGPRNIFAWSQAAGRSFAFFKEMPKDHWYPGAGIAFSFPRQV
jgi:hypothetical protein